MNKKYYIYFVRSGNTDYYKIGSCSGSPVRRVVKLQTGNPELLTLVYSTEVSSLENMRLIEGLLHRNFRTFKIRNRTEWYLFPGNMVARVIRRIAKKQTPFISQCLRKPRTSAAERAKRNGEIIRMYSDGNLSMTEIGKAFGISRQRVHQILKIPR